MGQRHDHDAGGDPQLLQAKAALRGEVWQALQDADASRFPGAEGRIPNFVGAEDAADRLRELEVWRRATTLKANPDSPLDVIVTPQRVLHCDRAGQPADGIRWDELTEDKIASIPLLQRLRPDV